MYLKNDFALIGKHYFGKLSSFSEEGIDVFVDSSDNTLLYLQISNQHLLSRLAGGDDIVVLQCFLVDPLLKGDLFIDSLSYSNLPTLPILGKDEILDNLKTSS